MTKSVLLHYRYHMRLGGTIRFLQVNKLNQRYIPREYLSSTCFFPPPFITCYTCTSTRVLARHFPASQYSGTMVSRARSHEKSGFTSYSGGAPDFCRPYKKKPQNGENLSCCIWGAPDFCVPPCTRTRTHILLDARLALDLASGS